MTQSFVGTREQVLSALMHAIRQFQRQRRNSRLWSLRTVRTCDFHSAWLAEHCHADGPPNGLRWIKAIPKRLDFARQTVEDRELDDRIAALLD